MALVANGEGYKGVKPGVLLLGNYPPPFGGVPSHVREVSHYLAKQGWRVHVVVGFTLHHGIEHAEDSVTVHRLSRWHKLVALWGSEAPSTSPRQFFPGRRLYLAWRAVFQYCRALVRSQNIKLISAYHISRHGTLGAWLNAETGVPLITTIFGEIYSQTDYFWKNRAEAEFVAAHSARLLSCSHHCARSVRLLDVDWPVQPLYYGIDLAHFRPGQDGTAIRRQLGWADGDKVVVYVGRMNHEMGVGILLRAIPKVLKRDPNVRFLLAGAADELEPQVQSCAAANPRNVAFLLNVPYDQLPSVYAAATVTVAPSINERACLGLAIIEAMGCAKPVVGARVGGTEEVLVEGETGYLTTPRDSSDLADKLLRALGASPKELGDMGRRGRGRAEALFDKELTNRRFESIVHEVLGTATGRANVYNATP